MKGEMYALILSTGASIIMTSEEYKKAFTSIEHGWPVYYEDGIINPDHVVCIVSTEVAERNELL